VGLQSIVLCSEPEKACSSSLRLGTGGAGASTMAQIRRQRRNAGADGENARRIVGVLDKGERQVVGSEARLLMPPPSG